MFLSIVFTLVFLAYGGKICNQNTVSKTPEKFGIQTMTYSRSLLPNSLEKFHNFISHYAHLDCDCFDNIYLVWNNQYSPKQMEIQISQSWKKKVIFTQTPYNSLGWKYTIPTSAPQEVFFTVDDDLYLSCQQLQKGFETWKKNSVGNLGPLVSYTKRSTGFIQEQEKFTYENTYIKKFYTISLMNCAFFSRQFADLYYSDYEQIRGIRKIVQEKQNCEDIAMNFIVSYFYPELVPKIQENTFKTPYTPGVSDAPDHYQKRNDCMNKFTSLISYNPLRYFQLGIKQQEVKKIDNTCIILMKQQFYRKQIRRKTPQQIFAQDAVFDPSLTKQQALQLKIKLKQNKINQHQSPSKLQNQEKQLKNQPQQINNQIIFIYFILLIVLALGTYFIFKKIKATKVHIQKNSYEEFSQRGIYLQN